MARYAFALFCAAFLAFAAVAYADTNANQLFSELEQAYQLPSGILGKVANVESGGNNSSCASTSSACGLFQWTTNSWENITKSVYGSAYDPSQRFDISISAKMTAVSLRQAENQNSGLIQQAGIDLTVGLYLCHFLGAGGCNKFFQLYIQNSQQSAAAAFPREAAANSNVFNGRTLADVVNFFSNRLNGTSATVNIAGNFQDANGVSYAYSDADVNSSYFFPASYNPPAQDPYHTYQTNYSGIAQTNSLTPLTQLSQPQLTSQVPTSTPTPTTTTSASSTQQIGLVPPAAIIIAQPKSVRRGYNLVVSWASVGMSSCQVLEQGTVIASAGSGTKSIPTSPLQSGAATFVLSCISPTGQSLQQSASASVQ